MSDNQTNSRLAPVQESQRIASLDVLRGFALLGILTMNIGSFSMPGAAYFDPTVYGDLEGLNRWVWMIFHTLCDSKFMAVFSMLFGAGIILMTERATGKGRPATGLHYRRMGWLIVFGTLHAHLLWYGDILYWYGMCGLVVYLFRNLSPRWLIFWGLCSITVASVLMLFSGLTLDYWPPEAVQEMAAHLKPSQDVLAEEIAAYRGGWIEQMAKRSPEALSMQTGTFLFWALWRVSGLMLLGMALYKLGVFSAARSRKFYLSLFAVGLLIGIPVIVHGIQRNFEMGWPAPWSFLVGLQYNYWASLLVALGWVSLIMLLCKSGLLDWLKSAFAAVGRTAFTNYILQTVICTAIFYGHGLGLFGSIERSGQVLIMIGVWILQLIVSPIWLRYFHFGPLEWVWRSLSYWRRQPFFRMAEG